MLFTSIPFLVLLVTTLLIYYAATSRGAQVAVLTLASFVFYAWESPCLLILLIISILINVVTSYLVAKGDPSYQKFWAVLGVTLNLGMLLFFKYSPLFARTVLGDADGSVGQFLMSIPLPIGISFFTFQGISLVVEVFRTRRPGPTGKYAALPELVPGTFSEHLANTMLFKAFFPNLVAGPIIKAHEFYPQIRLKTFRSIPWESAFRALVTGYFLKMVVADNLKDITANLTYPFFMTESPLTLLALLFGYSMQIFADFAGYSMIAIGLAHLFGYKLPANFNFPYLSRSFAEFWRRWHISLSTWLREYLYLPLGGNRRSATRTYLNLFLVMFLGGLWHGAAWSYAVWGTFHGLALAVERLCSGRIRLPENRFVHALQMAFVFMFVTFAWLLFKLPDFGQVMIYVKTLFNSHAEPSPERIACILTFSAPVMIYYGWHLLKLRWGLRVARFDFLLYGAMIVGTVLNSGTPGAFIYFQF